MFSSSLGNKPSLNLMVLINKDPVVCNKFVGWLTSARVFIPFYLTLSGLQLSGSLTRLDSPDQELARACRWPVSRFLCRLLKPSWWRKWSRKDELRCRSPRILVWCKLIAPGCKGSRWLLRRPWPTMIRTLLPWLLHSSNTFHFSASGPGISQAAKAAAALPWSLGRLMTRWETQRAPVPWIPCLVNPGLPITRAACELAYLCYTVPHCVPGFQKTIIKKKNQE